MLNTRFSRCAHVIARDGMYAGFAGAKTGHRHVTFSRDSIFCLIVYPTLIALATLRRRDQDTVLTVRMVRHPDKHTVETCQVSSGLGHQGGKPRHDKSAGQPICTTEGRPKGNVHGCAL